MNAVRLLGSTLVFWLLASLAGCSSSGGQSPQPLQATAGEASGALVPTPAAAEGPAPAPQPAVAAPLEPERLVLDPALVPWRNALARARDTQIARLATYRKAKHFPRNHIALNRTPIFIDSTGAHCAVAYLMRESGHGEVADRIAAQDNFVRIEDVKSGPLIDWIHRSGLIQEEAALIQPGYSWRAAEGTRREAEINDLVEHFTRVETLLKKTTEDSLDLALERLAPMIATGATVDDMVR